MTNDNHRNHSYARAPLKCARGFRRNLGGWQLREQHRSHRYTLPTAKRRMCGGFPVIWMAPTAKPELAW